MTRRFRMGWLVGAVAFLVACEPGAPEGELGAGAGGKADTGWIGDTSFEVGGTLEATAVRAASGEWTKLATDRALQEKLVDTQLKFGKNGAAEKGWHLNQLADRIEILEAVTDGERVAVRYRAQIDLIRKRPASDAETLPPLEELQDRELTLLLPEDPIGVYARVEDRCAEGHDSGLGEYNYYYYFAPTKKKSWDSDEVICDLVMREGKVQITKVYPARKVYPEYDALRNTIDKEQGVVGFRAAIVPMGSEFASGNKRTLEETLKLTGEASKDGDYTRYVLRKDKVEITIDLFNGYYSESFRTAIGNYQLVLYDGHSSYGTLDLLTDAKAYLDRYQIVIMDSCRSYEYYTRQVFRAKASAADPTGFARADVIGTGMPAPVSDSGKIIGPVLTGLADGLAAIERGAPEQATSWQTIVSRLNSITWDSVYGVAGARANAWQPPTR